MSYSDSYFDEYKNIITKEILDEAKKDGSVTIDEDNFIHVSTAQAMFEVLCDDFVFIEGAQEENKTVQEYVREAFSDINFDSKDLYFNDNNIIEYKKIDLGVEL